MSAIDLSEIMNQMGSTMQNMAYSIAFSECLQSVTQLSMMGMNATWADDVSRCFVFSYTVDGNSISMNVDIDVGNEFVLMTNARSKNLVPQNTNVDSHKSGESWIQNDPLNIEENLNMILENIRARCNNLANSVYEMYKDAVFNAVKEYCTNRIKEAIADV